MRRRLCLVAIAVLGVGQTRADDRFWLEDHGGSFHDAGSWVDGGDLGVPGESDTAIFDVGFINGPIVFESPTATNRVIIRSGFVEFDLDRSVYTLLETNPLQGGVIVGDDPILAPILRVDGGVLASRFVDVASVPNSFGSLELAGGALLDVDSHLRIGSAGLALLEITDASVEASYTHLGAAGSGSVIGTMAGSGTSLDSATELVVGLGGLGSFQISDGAAITSGSSIIAQQNGSVGIVDLRDPGTTWTIDGHLDVGRQGHGQLDVRDGATLVVNGFVTTSASGTGFPDTEFGVGFIDLDGPASMILVNGTVHASLLGPSTITLARGAHLLIDGDFLIGESPVEVIVQPGGPADYDLPAIDLTGMTPTGTGVQVTIEFVDGFVPVLGDRFELFRAETSLGDLDYTLPDPPAGLMWTIDQSATTAAAIVTNSADTNGDGVVDITDLLAVLDQWGPCPGCSADLNGDGVVDVTDLLAVLQGWTT